MTEDYDIEFDPIVEDPGSEVHGENLPKVLDSVMTVQVVQKFMEVERKRNRRALLWMSSVFLFAVLLILSLFAGIGMHVLKNSSNAANAAMRLQAQTAAYASEVLGISNKIEKLASGRGELQGLIRNTEDKRIKDGRVIRSDLERFGRWVELRTSKERKTIESLTTRLKDLESRLAEAQVIGSGAQTAVPAPPGNDDVSREPGEVGLDKPDIESAEESAAAAGHATVPEAAAGKIDGDFDIALAEPVRVAVPVPPLDRGDVSVVTFPNGDRYKGSFKAGLFHGWGEYSYKNGDYFEGSFDSDLKSGKGTYVYASGDKYVGEFDNDMRHGVGSMIFSNGDKYVGEFRNDTITGKGARFYSNGNKYSGDFKEGVKQGNGVLKYFNGDSYKGEFKNDLRDGRGVYVFSDGSKYIGEFKDDKRHGSGRFIFADGGEYIGGFKNGMKHGEGLSIYPDGRRLKGIWKEDKFLKVLD